MAESTITPPLGLHIPGYFHIREATGIKEDLKTKAMVIESDTVTLAFIVVDAISLELEQTEAIRDRVHQLADIPRENIMISATHTHTGPPRQLTPEAIIYSTFLVQKSADAAIIAYQRRQAVKLGFGTGHETSFAFNRRFLLKDGTYRTNAGVLNPQIVRAIGPIDPEVSIIRIDDMDGHPIGVISNYACHTDTVKGTEYSPDFPEYLSQTIKRNLGEHVVSLFFQGACGDINHIDVTGVFNDKDDKYHVKMGKILGNEVLKVRQKITAQAEPLKIGIRSRQVAIPSRKPSERDIREAQAVLDSLKDIPKAQFTNAHIQKHKIASTVIEKIDAEPTIRDYEIQVMNIGELAIVALPAEMFVAFGLTIKEKSPFPMVMINELSNGSGNGYVCVNEAYDQGGYEPSGLKFAVGAGDRFVQTALELLEELYTSQFGVK